MRYHLLYFNLLEEAAKHVKVSRVVAAITLFTMVTSERYSCNLSVFLLVFWIDIWAL